MKAEKILKYLNAEDYVTLMQLASEELRAEEAKKNYGTTTAKRLKAAQQYLKRHYNSYKPGLSLVNHEEIHGESVSTFTNGFSAFFFKDFPIEGYNPENLESTPMNLKSIFIQAEQQDNKEIYLDVDEIMACYKEVKAMPTLKTKNKWEHNYYKIGEKCFNLQYLKEVFEILGTEDIHFYSDNKWQTPALFKNNNDYALLIPVKVKDETQIINR